MPTKGVARNEILDMLRTAWKAVGAVTETALMIYPNVDADLPDSAAGTKDDPVIYGRVTIKHGEGQKRTLPGETGGSPNAHQVEHRGLIIVQNFAPNGEGLATNDAMDKIVKDAFLGERTPSGVSFGAESYEEVGNDGPWFQTNVSVPFLYDEIKL
tara:strand:+ start:602 stop:1069 length:468 start_codon:yes stop_codon:yes gene_type:complete